MVAAFVVSLILTSMNLAIFVAQLSSPANARGSASALLDDDDFVTGLSKLVRKTVRDYCTVGKKQAIDC
jgi:hypothetical protein